MLNIEPPLEPPEQDEPDEKLLEMQDAEIDIGLYLEDYATLFPQEIKNFLEELRTAVWRREQRFGDENRRKNMNLYELTREFESAMANIVIDEETGEVSGFEAVDTLDTAFEDKAEAYAVTIKNLLAEAAALKNERDNMKAREDAAKRRAEVLKKHLADSMTAVGKEKIETAKAALSFRRSKQVSIVNDELVPDDLCVVKIDRKPDKTAIGKLLKSGETVPGAELVENMNLQVK